MSSFTRLFDVFVAEDYTESQILSQIPPMRPNVAPAAEADLAAALDTAAVVNPADGATWPMAIVEKDGRTAIASTNTTYGSTAAAIEVPVTARAGDAIVVTFRTSTEASCDLLNIALNGQIVKRFGGEHDWMTYAIPVNADGEYSVGLYYIKDAMADGGKDMVWVDSVTVVSGDAAAAALAANPVYPVADAVTLTPINPNAREIVITDNSDMVLAYAFGPAKYYIINDDLVTFNATLTSDFDPEGASFYCYYDGSSIALPSAMTDGGYILTTGVDARETTGYTYAYVALYLDPTGMNMELTVYFRNEENVNAFVNAHGLGPWQYADGSLPGTAAAPGKAAQTSTTSDYVVKYVDQYGNPVAGVMCQVCDETTCQVFVSDENGLCAFTMAPYAWEIHTLKVPEGYEGDTQTITIAPVEGGEMVFTLTRL